MLPSKFEVAVKGEGQSPVPIKITIGPAVLFVCIAFLVVLALKGGKR